MRVLGIVGSPRIGGNTDILVDEILSGAREAGASTEKIILNNLNIKPCQACNNCYKTGQCSQKDDMADLLDKMLYTDFMTRLPEHSLMLTDRMTMAHSLEMRSPFLDHKLVEYLAAFPSRLKIQGHRTKYILRRLAEDYLPRDIVSRQKQGFMFPIAYWFRGDLSEFIERSLLNSHFVQEGLFRRESIVRLIEEHRSQRVDHHVRLWMLLNLELWHQLYIEGIKQNTLTERLQELCLLQ